jgi:hypothetical protein
VGEGEGLRRATVINIAVICARSDENRGGARTRRTERIAAPGKAANTPENLVFLSILIDIDRSPPPGFLVPLRLRCFFLPISERRQTRS